MPEESVDELVQKDTFAVDMIKENGDDTVTLNGSDDAVSATSSDGDGGDVLSRIIRKLDTITFNLENVASQTDSMISEKFLKLADQLDILSDEQSKSVTESAQDLNQENMSPFLSSTVGQVHVELNHELALLRKEVAEKTKENKMLHGVIQRSQIATDVTDDDIEKHFRNLRTEIERFSRTQLQAINPRLIIARMKPSNHPLWLESRIADKLYSNIFSKPIFGHSMPFEDVLADLENYLREKRVPDTDIRTWVADTVNITSRFKSRGNNQYVDRVSQHILVSLSEEIEFAAPKTVMEDMQSMCQIAYDIALVLRKSQTLYEWPQVSGRGLNEAHYNTLRGYDEPDSRGHNRQLRVLFGPVFKVGSGEVVCIRKGELLVPTDS